MRTNSNKRNERLCGTARAKAKSEGTKVSPAPSHGFASLVLIIASFLFIAIVAVSARSGWLSFAPPATPTVSNDALAINESSYPAAATTMHSAPAAQNAASAGHHGPVQNIRFTVYDVGILPRTLHAQTGIVAVSIEDLSGSAADLVVERETGNNSQAARLQARVGAVKHYAHHWRGREELVMTPGRYLVYMANRPGNYAELIVDPQS